MNRDLKSGSSFLILAILVVVPSIVLAGYLFYKTTGVAPEEAVVAPIEKYEVAKDSVQKIDQKINGYTARFEIYTHGTKRVFTSLMYHNLSTSVYISEPDPSVVHVKGESVTWDEFFKTLPFSLTKQCLTTGDKQTFCNDEKNALVFELNGVNTPDALDMVIKEGDILVIKVE